jgi:ribosomal protein S18 acetylase RimI-like enzyme
MIVRPVAPGDIPRIADLHVSCWQHAYPGLLPQPFLDGLSRERRERQWAHALARQTCTLAMAEDAGEVLGFAAYGRCRDVGAAPADHELWALHVAAGHWRQGIGKLLWERVQQDFMAAGAQSISLWVLEGNDRARKFYEAVGFGLQPESVKVENIGGADAVEVRYAMTPAREV